MERKKFHFKSVSIYIYSQHALFFIYSALVYCTAYIFTYYAGLRVYRKYRHCYARHHKRSANPTFRYRPHMSECVSPSSIVAVSSHDGCEELRQQSTKQPPVQRRLPAPQMTPTTTPPLKASLTPPISTPPQPPAHTDGWPPGHGLHKHLLLVTGQVYQEFISECSVAEQARDLRELGSKLERRPGLFGVSDFVLVQVGTGWRLNVQLLDVLVDRLGNVSMYADKKYYSKTMTKHCRNIGDRCKLLANLVPVIEQLELRQEFLVGGSGGGGMYDPDWIPVPAVPPLPHNFTGDTEKQIEYLTWRLCVRDRRQNFYYKLDQDSLRSPLRYTQSFGLKRYPQPNTRLSPPPTHTHNTHPPGSSVNLSTAVKCLRNTFKIKKIKSLTAVLIIQIKYFDYYLQQSKSLSHTRTIYVNYK